MEKIIHNYTQNAWQGTNYIGEFQSTKNLCKIFREYAKKEFPDCKFSISKQDYTGGRSISISLMEANFQVFSQVDPEVCEMQCMRNHWRTPEQMAENWENTVKSGHSDVNQYHLSDEYILTPKAKEVMTKMLGFVQSYNYDDSDAMVDYFSTNFYLHASIGKWDKPFKLLTR